MISDINFQNLTKWPLWQQNRTVGLLVSLIHSNSITQLIPNPFQIDSDMQIHISKTKIPISSKTSIKLTISNHHNFALKTLQNSSNTEGRRARLETERKGRQSWLSGEGSRRDAKRCDRRGLETCLCPPASALGNSSRSWCGCRRRRCQDLEPAKMRW